MQNKCFKCLPYCFYTNKKKFSEIFTYFELCPSVHRLLQETNKQFSQHFGKMRGKAQVPWSSVFMQHLIRFIFTTHIGLFDVISWKHFDIIAKFSDHTKKIMKYFIYPTRTKQLYVCLLKCIYLVFSCTRESKAPHSSGNQGHEKFRNWPHHNYLLLNTDINRFWITN